MQAVNRHIQGIGSIMDEKITEEFIYQRYQKALKEEHTQPFKDFSQGNRDAYIRLKFRA